MLFVAGKKAIRRLNERVEKCFLQSSFLLPFDPFGRIVKSEEMHI